MKRPTKTQIIVITLMAWLSVAASALEGNWCSKETRYDFIAGEVEYLYSFQSSGEGTATLLASRSYGPKRLEPKRFNFLYQKLELFGTDYLLIVELSQSQDQEPDVEWYQIAESTEDQIITTHRGAQAIFTRICEPGKEAGKA